MMSQVSLYLEKYRTANRSNYVQTSHPGTELKKNLGIGPCSHALFEGERGTVRLNLDAIACSALVERLIV
jgi:hypothetical protein